MGQICVLHKKVVQQKIIIGLCMHMEISELYLSISELYLSVTAAYNVGTSIYESVIQVEKPSKSLKY